MPKFPLELDSDLIVLDVEFKGRNRRTIPMRMALDTGANMTTIPLEMGILLGLKIERPVDRIEMLTASGIEYDVRTVTVPKIKFFNFELKNVKALCHSLHPRSVAVGLLGMNVLSLLDIRLNIPKNFIEISRP